MCPHAQIRNDKSIRSVLAHELALLQFDPAYGISASMVRASHTLCGIHRTGGFRSFIPWTYQPENNHLKGRTQANVSWS